MGRLCRLPTIEVGVLWSAECTPVLTNERETTRKRNHSFVGNRETPGMSFKNLEAEKMLRFIK